MVHPHPARAPRAGNGNYGGASSYGGANGYGGTSGYGGSAPGQAFSDVTLSSTGDPHLAETGTRLGPGGPQAVNDRFDSMSSHDDLIDARGLAGGYRVSTTVTQPDAKGITSNQSATVHANCGRDGVTMNRDGSYSVTSNGQAVALTPGQTLTLGGGENVTRTRTVRWSSARPEATAARSARRCGRPAAASM